MRKMGCVTGAALLLLVLVQAVAVGATKPPVISAVRAPATAQVQQSFSADVVVANRRRTRSGRAQVKVVWSRDATFDDGDVRVATLDVPRLKPGARRVFEVRVRPKRAGEHRLIACIRRQCRGDTVLVKAPGQDPAAPPPAGNPLDVTPTLDNSRAASALVTAEDGGTINATSEDGSTFELVIPPDGLMGDERITMTPVADLAGDPFAAPVSAVDIKPHGLQLGRLAMLTITPPAPIPLGRQFVFATRAGGKDFHAYPPTQDTTSIELQLSHFSIGGVGSSTEAERAAAVLRGPADAQAQLEKQIGERAQEMKRSGNFDGDLLVPSLLEYYQRVVKPRLEAALTDDTLAILAIASYHGWQRQAELVTADHALTVQLKQGRDLMIQVTEFAFERAYARCMNGETAYLRVMMAMERSIVLLGAGDDLDGQALQRLITCARFELDFDARVELHTQDNRSQGTQEHWEVTVAAHDVPLLTTINEDHKLVTTGAQSLVVTEWFYSNSAFYADDWAAGNVELVAPLAVEASLPLSYRLETAADGRTRYVLVRGRPSVDIDPGKIKLFYTKGGDFQYPSSYNYEDLFFHIWTPERLAERPGFFRFGAFFDALPPKLGLFLEERTLHRVFDDFVTDRYGRLRMEIEHAPQR